MDLIHKLLMTSCMLMLLCLCFYYRVYDSYPRIKKVLKYASDFFLYAGIILFFIQVWYPV